MKKKLKMVLLIIKTDTRYNNGKYIQETVKKNQLTRNKTIQVFC